MASDRCDTVEALLCGRNKEAQRHIDKLDLQSEVADLRARLADMESLRKRIDLMEQRISDEDDAFSSPPHEDDDLFNSTVSRPGLDRPALEALFTSPHPEDKIEISSEDQADVKGVVAKTIDEIDASFYSRVQLQLLHLAHRLKEGEGTSISYTRVALEVGQCLLTLSMMLLQYIAFSVIGDEQTLRAMTSDVDDDQFSMGQDDSPHNFRFAYRRSTGGLPLPTMALVVFCTVMVALYTLSYSDIPTQY